MGKQRAVGGVWRGRAATWESSVNARVLWVLGVYAMRTYAVQNPYVRGVRFWWVKATCGGCVNVGLRFCGGCRITSGAGLLGWVKSTVVAGRDVMQTIGLSTLILRLLFWGITKPPEW